MPDIWDEDARWIYPAELQPLRDVREAASEVQKALSEHDRDGPNWEHNKETWNTRVKPHITVTGWETVGSATRNAAYCLPWLYGSSYAIQRTMEGIDALRSDNETVLKAIQDYRQAVGEFVMAYDALIDSIQAEQPTPQRVLDETFGTE